MHTIQAAGILSAQNGMNIYRGCTHGCIYCDSRSLCYQMEHDFEDVAIKANAPALLEDSLKRKRKKCMISTGSMSDPYLPIERSTLLTRRCLELIDHYEFGLAILTKSNLILRDLDLLKSIHKKSKCVVQMTMTTYDEALCKKLEPHVCTTKERFAVLKKMQECGIPTVVWLSPFLPYINDTKENIMGLLNFCKEAGVHGIICFNIGLTLRDGNREYYYAQLDKLFPGLSQKYINLYGYSYEILSPHNNELMKMMRNFCKENDILFGPDKCFDYMRTFECRNSYEQLSFDFL